MKKFRIVDVVTGWVVFAISLIIYILTLEPTASFWDCGEFITTAFKLNVGHPPGAPLFMIMARFASLFALGDVTKVAYMINLMSATTAAFTVLFLFWTITHIAKKILVKKQEYSTEKIIAIMGAGVVGALAYAFSDTQWFSAVEAEVYASSSMFTAIVFWAILKWENIADEPYANRWIILIAYLMGLSIGVHLLNLLTIPALAMVYYFKKYPVTRNGIISAFGISVLLLAVVLYGIIPGIVLLATRFELIFTNSFGLPYNTGSIFYAALLIGLVIWGLYYSYAKGKVLLNTILLAFTVIVIGYSSFAMVVIRSAANPPMDQNSPDNVFALHSYLQREQYGENPVFKGPYFTESPTGYDKGRANYIKKDGKYVIADYKISYKYDPGSETIFPRMYSSSTSPNHPEGYMKWTGLEDGEKPTFSDNLAFFFKYQVNFMYIRYFMWNFAGRQSDTQSHGESMNGNWISGISFIDNARLGDQSKLPDFVKNNQGRNVYFFLPLLLGILGAVFMFRNHIKYASVVALLFLFTGLAIVVFLNQPPYQPRERDYAYAASFYTFSIFLGFGVLFLYDFFKKYLSGKMIAPAVSILAFLVPLQMLAENYDDHDRSNRYTARDFAKNYLDSCEPNAIIFTNGDNDTFPLWYIQEVEGYRTDIRVINLSYLNTDWYIDQMKRKAYKSDIVPFQMTKDQYVQGKRDIVYVNNQIDKPYDLRKLIDFVASDNPETKLLSRSGDDEAADYFPAKDILLKVDKQKVLANGTVQMKDTAQIVDFMQWSLRGDYIHKNELMVLDLVANFNWDRPIYWAITVGPDAYMNLDQYFQLDGLAYRLVPIRTVNADGQTGRVNADLMYEKLMNKFVWGNLNNPKVYIDENNRRMTMNIRNNFARCAYALIDENKFDKAIEVLDRSTELMPNERIPFNYYNLLISEAYFKAKANEKGDKMVRTLVQNIEQTIRYYLSVDRKELPLIESDLQREFAILQETGRILKLYNRAELANEVGIKFEQLLSGYQAF
jgi:hypothetical protein